MSRSELHILNQLIDAIERFAESNLSTAISVCALVLTLWSMFV
jgi:hypothetical protein